MRLIDGDALDYTFGASDEDIYFHHMLEDAPTIDAIPVEWMQEMMMEREAEESRAAWVVLREWKKEQEAR